MRSRYIFHYENHGATYDESNFYEMLRESTRNPNIELLKAFEEVILSGYCIEIDNQYSAIDALENFADNTYWDSCQYIRFCYAVSSIRERMKLFL